MVSPRSLAIGSGSFTRAVGWEERPHSTMTTHAHRPGGRGILEAVSAGGGLRARSPPPTSSGTMLRFHIGEASGHHTSEPKIGQLVGETGRVSISVACRHRCRLLVARWPTVRSQARALDVPRHAVDSSCHSGVGAWPTPSRDSRGRCRDGGSFLLLGPPAGGGARSGRRPPHLRPRHPSPAPGATPTGPRRPASATRTYPSASPTVGSRRSTSERRDRPDGTAADDGSARPAATAAVARPRVFRTPSAAPPAFVAPGGAAEEETGWRRRTFPSRRSAPTAGTARGKRSRRLPRDGSNGARRLRSRVAYLGASARSATAPSRPSATPARARWSSPTTTAARCRCWSRARRPCRSRSTSSAASRSSRARVSTPAPSPCGSRRSRATASEPIRRSSW